MGNGAVDEASGVLFSSRGIERALSYSDRDVWEANDLSPVLRGEDSIADVAVSSPRHVCDDSTPLLVGVWRAALYYFVVSRLLTPKVWNKSPEHPRPVL